jgi:sporulation protein YlmC with PRC-barrel domain
MKKFATELRGKTVMTNDGQILGMIENFIVDTKIRREGSYCRSRA